MEELYYDHPVQVLFWDEYKYKCGIAFHNYIVDVTDGNYYMTGDIIHQWNPSGGPDQDDMIIELSWEDLHYNFVQGLAEWQLKVRKRRKENEQ